MPILIYGFEVEVHGNETTGWQTLLETVRIPLYSLKPVSTDLNKPNFRIIS